MTLDDLFADRQAHTGPFKFFASDQTLKGLKELWKISFVKTNTVVFDIDATLRRATLSVPGSGLRIFEASPPNSDNGGLAVAVELQGITDEVLQ